jgi:hypothetical protein
MLVLLVQSGRWSSSVTLGEWLGEEVEPGTAARPTPLLAAPHQIG